MSALIQNTSEWMEMRLDHIGSSDAPIIMGVSPWTTRYQLWQQKLKLSPGPKENHAMAWGKQNEEAARVQFEQITGLIVVPQVLFHDKHKWMMASFDGMDFEQKNIVEIKCSNAEDHELAKSGKIPEKYYPQLQHQIAVANLDKSYYFSFHKEDGVVVEVFRDDEYIKGLIDKELEFYKNVKNFLPPELTSKDYVRRDEDLWCSTVSEYLLVQKKLEELRQLEEKEKDLREVLISMCQNQNSIGAGIKITKIVRKGNIDYSAIKELKKIDLNKYRKDPVEFWKISKES